jgi:hypothetical protein
MERRSSQFQAPEFLKNTDGIMKKFWKWAFLLSAASTFHVWFEFWKRVQFQRMSVRLLEYNNGMAIYKLSAGVLLIVGARGIVVC